MNQSLAQNGRPSQASAPSSNRGPLLIILTLAIIVVGIGVGLYWFFVLSKYETTDDAYVNGHLVVVTSQVAGTVIGVQADDTDKVAAGAPLVRLDPADAQVAREEAETELAKTVRQVRNMFATVAQLQASVDVRRSDVTRAEDDLKRRERLTASGAISEEELRHARETLRSAQASLIVAERQLGATRALVDGTDVAHHPDVLNAAAKLRDVYLTLARTDIPAPVAGTVARRTVQVGSRISPGTALMSLIALDQVWVDANFKEVQLSHMRIGQPVTLTADLYGGKVTYHGKVHGFGAGTGSAFALLPPQNATGNWVKVVQRLPVRISLDPQELSAHPLQIGLSMDVSVDIDDQNGPPMKPVPTSDAEATRVFETAGKNADEHIAEIVAANLGMPDRDAGR